MEDSLHTKRCQECGEFRERLDAFPLRHDADVDTQRPNVRLNDWQLQQVLSRPRPAPHKKLIFLPPQRVAGDTQRATNTSASSRSNEQHVPFYAEEIYMIDTGTRDRHASIVG